MLWSDYLRRNAQGCAFIINLFAFYPKNLAKLDGMFIPSEWFLSTSLDTRQIRTSPEHVYVRHKISFSWAAESKTRPDMNLKYNLSPVPTVLNVNADWKSLMSDLEYSTSGGALWGREWCECIISELCQDTAGVQRRSVITSCQEHGEHQS